MYSYLNRWRRCARWPSFRHSKGKTSIPGVHSYRPRQLRFANHRKQTYASSVKFVNVKKYSKNQENYMYLH